jgi:hypothetical protein
MMAVLVLATLSSVGGALGAPLPVGPGKIGIEIAGTSAGWVWSAEGGNAVIGPRYAAPNGTLVLGAVTYDTLAISFGTGMSTKFLDLVKVAGGTSWVSTDGAVVWADSNLNVLSRLEFGTATLVGLVMPAVDAAVKNPARATAILMPDTSATKKGAGKSTIKTSQKLWLTSDFRLKIDGLPTAPAHVSKVDAITIRRKPPATGRGQAREYGGWEVSNVVVTLPEPWAGEIATWYAQSVGASPPSSRVFRTGTIEYLTPTAEVLYTVSFKGLGLSRVATNGLSGETVPTVKAEMTCESATFSYGPAASAM